MMITNLNDKLKARFELGIRGMWDQQGLQKNCGGEYADADSKLILIRACTNICILIFVAKCACNN